MYIRKLFESRDKFIDEIKIAVRDFTDSSNAKVEWSDGVYSDRTRQFQSKVGKDGELIFGKKAIVLDIVSFDQKIQIGDIFLDGEAQTFRISDRGYMELIHRIQSIDDSISVYCSEGRSAIRIILIVLPGNYHAIDTNI